MPKGTPVEKMYSAMVREGMDKGKAARISQSKTGLALATGRPPKSKAAKIRRRTGRGR
jgi:hypothetical protein